MNVLPLFCVPWRFCTLVHRLLHPTFHPEIEVLFFIMPNAQLFFWGVGGGGWEIV